MPDKKKALGFLKRTLFFILPVVLLFIIFRKIDFGRLVSILKEADPLFIMLGIFLKPLIIFIGSWRWKLLNNYYVKGKLSFYFLSVHYWAGLAIGYFTPGNLGWDAYRVMIVGKKIDSYAPVIMGVVAEKFLGLVSVVFMALAIYPFITDQIVDNKEIFQFSYYTAIGGLFIIFLMILLYRKAEGSEFYQKVGSFFGTLFTRFASSMNLGNVLTNVTQDFSTSKNFLSILRSPLVLIWTFSLSWAILFVTAICTQFIFLGLDYEIDFWINLFVAPVFFVLFLVPLSFGSIGVREGAYILLFGQFGVPMETALLVSFLNLIGLLLNNAIGALFIFFGGLDSSIKKDKKTPN